MHYQTTLAGIDWHEMKARLAADDFDNGRTAEQLQRSFEHSAATVVAHASGLPVGTARALSDGVCNAYVVDVWTFTPYRRRGIARRMMALLEERLTGQHVALFAAAHAGSFYQALGYRVEPGGLSRVMGTWLRHEP